MTSTFPYLRVAKTFGVPYAEVLLLADRLDHRDPYDRFTYIPGDWKDLTIQAHRVEAERRAAVVAEAEKRP